MSYVEFIKCLMSSLLNVKCIMFDSRFPFIKKKDMNWQDRYIDAFMKILDVLLVVE